MNARSPKLCMTLLLATATGPLGVSGCALMSRGDALQVRYFTLEDGGPTPAPGTPSELALRLGRVEASGGLDEQIAVRKGAHELSYRDDERWTERPAQYVRRELERALFRERGLTRSYSGFTPQLEVELVELELVDAEQPQARVRLIAELRDERRGLCMDSFQAQLPIAAQSSRANMEQSVAALSSALHQAVEQLADHVLSCLSATAAKPANPEPSGPNADAHGVDDVSAEPSEAGQAQAAPRADSRQSR